MNIIVNHFVSYNSLNTNLVNTLHDQALGVTEIFLTISKHFATTQYQEFFELNLDLINIYAITKIPSKSLSIKESIHKFHNQVSTRQCTPADIMQSVDKFFFNSIILTRIALKVTLTLGKREIIPLYSNLKALNFPLAFSLSFFGLINSAININRLQFKKRSLPKENHKHHISKKELRAFYRSHLSSYSDDTNSNSSLKINKNIVKIYEKQLETTTSKQIILQMQMAQAGSHNDKIIPIKNAKTLIDRKLKVEYANIASTLFLTTIGVLCLTGGVNPLIPLAFKGGSLLIDAGVAWYNIYGLNKGLKPITNELLQVG